MTSRGLLPTAFLLLAALSPLSAASDPATPRGRFLELHSCELYAGSCVVSAEANVSGNYLLRVWQFDEGALAGVPLRGLSVALLEKGPQNLAVPQNAARAAVAYLPPALTAPQRAALLAWAARNTRAQLHPENVRTLAFTVAFAPDRVRFTAGSDLAFSGAMPPDCGLSSCGEMLWYEPRVAATSFVVDQLDSSRIVEPLLDLTWRDHGRRTLFAGRFGDPEPAIPPVCGAARTASL
jgi:hypothetical protein